MNVNAIINAAQSFIDGSFHSVAYVDGILDAVAIISSAPDAYNAACALYEAIDAISPAVRVLNDWRDSEYLDAMDNVYAIMQELYGDAIYDGESFAGRRHVANITAPTGAVLSVNIDGDATRNVLYHSDDPDYARQHRYAEANRSKSLLRFITRAAAAA